MSERTNTLSLGRLYVTKAIVLISHSSVSVFAQCERREVPAAEVWPCTLSSEVGIFCTAISQANNSQVSCSRLLCKLHPISRASSWALKPICGGYSHIETRLCDLVRTNEY